MTDHPVVSPKEWRRARAALLAREKAHTRAGDELARARRELPWARVEADYVFDGPEGERTLGELFAGRRQLAVYHFMFGPGWSEGCKSCSFWADHFDGMLPHLAARDVALVAVSRAPLDELQPFKERMGWRFPWLSSARSHFNTDFGVSFPGRSRATYNYAERGVGEEMPGLSAFYRADEGAIYHTYSCYGRGLDAFNATYQLLDRMPRGRDEDALEFTMAWVRHHDRYAG